MHDLQADLLTNLVISIVSCYGYTMTDTRKYHRAHRDACIAIVNVNKMASDDNIYYQLTCVCVSVCPHQFLPTQPINNGGSVTSTLSKFETYYIVTYLYYTTVYITLHYYSLHYKSTVLHCIALHCIALHCIALHCIALHCIALHCIALHCIALHCIALHCIALHCIALHCIALHCIALHCIALHCIALHCIALHCIALHCIALHCIALHCIALHCIALHCIALHCIALYSCQLSETETLEYSVTMQANAVLCTISSFDCIYNFFSFVHSEVCPVIMQSCSVDVPFVFHKKHNCEGLRPSSLL